jgi:chromosomal replication initiation ATPase DnaA
MTPTASSKVGSGGKAESPGGEGRVTDLLAKPFLNRMGVRPGKPTIAAVIQFMCETYHLTRDELLSGRRDKWVWRARQEAYWRARTEVRAPLGMIARIFRKDITTVRHGIEMHEARMGAQSGAQG